MQSCNSPILVLEASTFHYHGSYLQVAVDTLADVLLLLLPHGCMAAGQRLRSCRWLRLCWQAVTHTPRSSYHRCDHAALLLLLPRVLYFVDVLCSLRHGCCCCCIAAAVGFPPLFNSAVDFACTSSCSLIRGGGAAIWHFAACNAAHNVPSLHPPSFCCCCSCQLRAGIQSSCCCWTQRIMRQQSLQR
jgi:hypothetical protein